MFPLRILQVIAPAPMGGAETVVLTLAEALAAAGHDVTVAAIIQDPGAHPFVERARGLNLDIVEVRTAHRAYRTQAARLTGVARERAVDAIHTHGYHADALGYVVQRRTRIPVVATLHGFTGEGLVAAIHDRIARFVHRRLAGVVAVSEPIVARLRDRGVDPRRIHLVPNAAPALRLEPRDDARRRLGIPLDAFAIGWAGRLSVEKGADVFIDALLSGIPSCDVSIIGDGPLRAELEDRATQHGLHIRWHGSVPGAALLLPAFEALVLSSRTEGTPMVLLEAMRAGVPIIATRVGGVPHMLAEDEAFLVGAEQPAALAEAIRTVHEQPGIARERATRARHRVERQFSAVAWADRHSALYAEAAAIRR